MLSNKWMGPRWSAAQDLHFFPSIFLRTALTAALCLLRITAPPAAHAASSGKPPVALDEFFNAVDFSTVALSPDGHMVAIATGRADWKNERFRQDLWLWRDSDGLLIPLTQSGREWEPKWSPDSKWIAFLSDRDGVMNVWSMDPNGHGPKQESHQKFFDVQSASASDGIEPSAVVRQRSDNPARLRLLQASARHALSIRR